MGHGAALGKLQRADVNYEKPAKKAGEAFYRKSLDATSNMIWVSEFVFLLILFIQSFRFKLSEDKNQPPREADLWFPF